jgi:internalin A
MLTLLCAILLQAPAPPPEGVVIVDYVGTHFADTHVTVLQAIPHVRQLILADTNITDAGIAEIAKFKNLAALEQLNLSNAGITDAAIVHLLALKNLKVLNLAGTKVTPAGILKLRRALPGLRIRR